MGLAVVGTRFHKKHPDFHRENFLLFPTLFIVSYTVFSALHQYARFHFSDSDFEIFNLPIKQNAHINTFCSN